MRVLKEMNQDKEIQDLENEFSAFDGKQSFKLPDDYMNQLKNQAKHKASHGKSFSFKDFVWPILVAACITAVILTINFTSSNTKEVSYAFENSSNEEYVSNEYSEEDIVYFLDEIEYDEDGFIEEYLMDEVEDISVIEDKILKCIKC